jgi:acetylornithine deacetylase
MLDPVELLAQLVAIPSVNPMGGITSGPHCGEARLTAFLEHTLRGLGLTVFRQPVAPGQDNLLACLEGDPSSDWGGTTILFDAHQDTVPVEGMTIDPWDPVIRDGRLYGRGSCDVKGGMAAMIAALSQLADEPRAGRPTVVMSCTVNEEDGFSGVNTLVDAWTPGHNSPLGRRPDLAIIAEPTQLDVVVAHKGVVRWRCHTRGRAAHSSRPELGENAIYRMGRVLAIFEHYQNEVVASLGSHPLCGAGTFSVGTIRGGSSVNTVPDRCTVEIDRRFPPGDQPETAYRHLLDYLTTHGNLGFPVEHDPPHLQAPALSDADNGLLADRLADAVNTVCGRCRKTAVPYATDAARISLAGVPAVVCGPGSIDQAHTACEWIDIDQLRQAVDVYARFVRSWTPAT